MKTTKIFTKQYNRFLKSHLENFIPFSLRKSVLTAGTGNLPRAVVLKLHCDETDTKITKIGGIVMKKTTMSVQELSAQMGISLPKAYELVKEPGFPTIRIGAKILIPIEAYKEWLVRSSLNNRRIKKKGGEQDGRYDSGRIKEKKLWFLWSTKPAKNGKVAKVPCQQKYTFYKSSKSFAKQV